MRLCCGHHEVDRPAPTSQHQRSLPRRIRTLLDQQNHLLLTDTQSQMQCNRRMARPCVFGNITRELYEVWNRKATTDGSIVPGDKVQELFHQILLYPSQAQVSEMIQYGRERELGNRGHPGAGSSPCASPFLTFGEFCFFATQLKKCYEREIAQPVQMSKLPGRSRDDKRIGEREISKSAPKYEVFLGGSCNPTTWRQEVAIPVLKNLGITYYNPQVSHWGPELIELEHQAKQSASVLFFVIDRQTRSVASIIEAAYTAATRQKLVLVILPYEGPGQRIWGEPISKQEYEDLSAGQMVLQDLVERREIPVFNNIRLALECTAKILKDRIDVDDLTFEDGVSPIKYPHLPMGYKLMKVREAFSVLDTASTGELSIADVCMAFRILTNRHLTVDELKHIIACNGDQSIDFDQFCCILAEFRNPATDSKCTWNAVVGKAAALLQSVTTPVTRALCRPKPVTRCDSCSPEAAVGGVKDVYLGGSCGTSTWREQIAIPLLKKNGLTYFNPEMCCWSRRFLPMGAAAMDASRVLLFVITHETRSLSAMALAAHYIGIGCNVVLCIQYLTEDCQINGEQLTRMAVNDYNRGRSYLSDLANRENVPVFKDAKEAVECVIQRCQRAS